MPVSFRATEAAVAPEAEAAATAAPMAAPTTSAEEPGPSERRCSPEASAAADGAATAEPSAPVEDAATRRGRSLGAAPPPAVLPPVAPSKAAAAKAEAAAKARAEAGTEAQTATEAEAKAAAEAQAKPVADAEVMKAAAEAEAGEAAGAKPGITSRKRTRGAPEPDPAATEGDTDAAAAATAAARTEGSGSAAAAGSKRRRDGQLVDEAADATPQVSKAPRKAAAAAAAAAAEPPPLSQSLSQDGGPSSGSATGGKREVHKNVRVNFSGFDNLDLRNKLTKMVKSLKGSVEESKDAGAVLGCTHLVVDTAAPGGLKRTAKLCVAISRPLVRIVQAKWLAACEMAGTFVSAEPYLLEGEHAKDNWSFNATTSRKAAAEGPGCLHGVAFVVTNETKPSQADLKAIILAAGGEVLEKPPSGAKGNKGVFVVSTADEVRTWQKLASLPSVRCVLRADHVLTCVLQQALDTTNGRLEA